MKKPAHTQPPSRSLARRKVTHHAKPARDPGPIKWTIWITGGLFMGGLALILLASRGGPPWMNWAGKLLLAALLFMPGVLLIVDRTLYTIWLRSLFDGFGRKPAWPHGPLMQMPPEEIKDENWSAADLSGAAVIAILCACFGGILVFSAVSGIAH